MRAEELQRQQAVTRQAQGLEQVIFHTRVPLDLGSETCGEIVELLAKVVQCGMLLFCIPKNVTSERPIAVLPTLTRWSEWLRPPVDLAKAFENVQVTVALGDAFRFPAANSSGTVCVF